MPVSSHSDLDRLLSGTLMPGFVGLSLPEWLEKRLRTGLGGVCLFGDNIQDEEQLRRLTGAILTANPNAIIAIDEEGGDVTRLHYRSGSPFPGNAILGRLDDEESTAAVGRAVGRELAAAGVNLALAPDVDINSNPLNPVIGVRSFGADADVVSAHSAAWTRGVQSTGVAACAKHFPGHGDTDQDSHLALPVIDRSRAELMERELVPFMAAISAGAKTVMTSHIMLPQIDPHFPATMSPAILGGLLRETLGFEGVIVSDALDMHGASGVLGIPEAAARSLQAGVDLLCIGSRNSDEQLGEIIDHLRHALDNKTLSRARVEDAASRVIALANDLRERSADHASHASVLHARKVPDIADVMKAFDGEGPARTDAGNYRDAGCIVRVDTPANIAVGHAPWGPFAGDSIAPGLVGWMNVPVVPFDAATDGTVYRDRITRTVLEVASDGPIIVIGKNNHASDNVQLFIDSLRGTSSRVLVVDMGWPAEDRRYADIATFGASRLAGQALVAFLAGDGQQ